MHRSIQSDDARRSTPITRAYGPCGAGAPFHGRPRARAPGDWMMLEELPDDLMSRLGYRIAFGEAARLAEMAMFDHGWGRDFAAGVGGESDAIEKEVLRRCGHGIHAELIELAVQDAVDRRKPRW